MSTIGQGVHVQSNESIAHPIFYLGKNTCIASRLAGDNGEAKDVYNFLNDDASSGTTVSAERSNFFISTFLASSLGFGAL